MTRLRDAVPGVSFAVEYETAYGHEPDYPNWSFGEEAVELIGPAEDLLTPAPGRHVLKLLAHHPTLPLDVFYEQARRSAGSSAETTHSTGLSLVEFSAPGVTKAATLLAWSSRLGITADEIAAFGDMPIRPCAPMGGSNRARRPGHGTSHHTRKSGNFFEWVVRW